IVLATLYGCITETSGPAAEKKIEKLEEFKLEEKECEIAKKEISNSVEKKDIDGIIKHLQNSHPSLYIIRMHAAGALGEIRDPRAVQPLIDALKDEHEHVRFCVIGALEEIGDARSVEPLIDAIKGKRRFERKVVAEALKKITGESLGKDHGKWEAWWEQNKGTIQKSR
ncbi:unnamed protein product, partial [marine sediment metagenome]